MLTREQLNFLIQVMLAKTAQGQPLVSVGIEHAKLAAATFDELHGQIAMLTSSPDSTPEHPPVLSERRRDDKPIDKPVGNSAG